MTTRAALSHGPLFERVPEVPAGSGTSGTQDIARETSMTRREVPEVPEPTRDPVGKSRVVTGEFRRFSSGEKSDPEKANDSRRVPGSGTCPLRGDEPLEPADAPSESSAALTLRSQRTDSGGSGPGPGSTPESELGSGPKLRPYQTEAITAIERELSARRATLLVLPTGCGKTVVFSELIRREIGRGGRALVLAHRTELLDQAAKKLLDVGVYASVDQGQRKGSHLADVVVGSVQTLRGVRLERYAADAFSLIVVDEAHHAAAQSYRSILGRFESARVLGVTATPDRGDGKALGKVFESVAYSYEMRRAIAESFLAPLHAKRILVEKMDLSEVRTHHGDFDQTELSKLLNEDENLLGVVKPLLEQAGDRKTLVFGVDVAHARALAEVINAHKPGKAIALDGTAKPEERKAVLALFRKGVFQYLCNCALFTEGFDEPDIACVALARPTQSRALYTQMLGRGTRLAPGKRDCLVLDFVGNSGRHRLIGPADALAGRELTDDERKIAAKKLEDGQTELEGVLADAEREAKEQKAARRRELNSAALVLYRQREVDLFLGDLMPGVDPDDPAAHRPATPQQLADIEAAKLGKPPVGLSEAEAAAMLKAVKARREAGLCTIPQARLLENRLGCDTKGMTFARAQELIGAVASRNAWRSPWTVLSGQPEYKPHRRRP